MTEVCGLLLENGEFCRVVTIDVVGVESALPRLRE